MQLRAEPRSTFRGDITVPGDKSISHRALMLAGLAVGESRIDGLLEGEDVLATARALAATGVEVNRTGKGSYQVFGRGIGGLSEPDCVLDMGNAGTGARLLLGILAGHEMTAFVSGDASLCKRPMRRVIEPLSQMGGSFLARRGDRLPLAVTGRSNLIAVDYRSPVASAQVKSAVLLAGLHARGRTSVTEPAASRDHSERMLKAMGADIGRHHQRDGSVTITIQGQPELRPTDVTVPGDPSSAAFPLAAAAATPGSEVLIRQVSINPLRTGLLTTLRDMGAAILEQNVGEIAGEPVADLLVSGRRLKAVDVPSERAPSMIDEYPVLAVIAAMASGRTVMRGLAELRVKESDRLQVMADGLQLCGIACEIDGDDLIVDGGTSAVPTPTINAQLDHRIALSFLVLGSIGRIAVQVEVTEAIETSFPGFAQMMNGLGASITPCSGHQA